jgi:hypothetical protein
MVAAYLRGILYPEPAYGLRSALSEDVLIEAMAAQISVETYDANMALDAAMLPVLNTEGVRHTMKSIGARSLRCSELRLMDIYRLEQKARNAIDQASEKNTPSLYQLYQIAERQGIFDALRAQDPVTTDD